MASTLQSTRSLSAMTGNRFWWSSASELTQRPHIGVCAHQILRSGESTPTAIVSALRFDDSNRVFESTIRVGTHEPSQLSFPLKTGEKGSGVGSSKGPIEDAVTQVFRRLGGLIMTLESEPLDAAEAASASGFCPARVPDRPVERRLSGGSRSLSQCRSRGRRRWELPRPPGTRVDVLPRKTLIDLVPDRVSSTRSLTP